MNSPARPSGTTKQTQPTIEEKPRTRAPVRGRRDRVLNNASWGVLGAIALVIIVAFAGWAYMQQPANEERMHDEERMHGEERMHDEERMDEEERMDGEERMHDEEERMDDEERMDEPVPAPGEAGPNR